MKLFEITVHRSDPEKKEIADYMRRAAVMMFQGRQHGPERVKLEIQTIGLNKGLSIQDAEEIARNIVATEQRRRRESD